MNAFARRFLLVAAVAATLWGCRRGPAPSMPTYLGDARATEVDPSTLDPALADAWDRLRKTWAASPESDDVPAIADEILASDPPLALALEALRAKAAHAYLVGRDGVAAGTADAALDKIEPGRDADPLELELLELRLRALARGGDPQQALAELAEPRRGGRSGLPPGEIDGLRAVALERDAQYVAAVAAYARWRQSLPDDGPAAAYASERMYRLGTSLPAPELRAMAETMESSAARRCVEALAGGQPVAEDLPWVRACSAGAVKVGVLLPRSGPLSALADAQLAAASVSAVALRDSGHGAFAWRDAGSSPRSAAAGARALLEDGVNVIVGPVGTANVRAVAEEVAGRARVVVPGETVGNAVGVAPSLEARLGALVRLAKARGGKQFMVLAPDNGYGRRSLAAIRSAMKPSERDDLVVQTYPPNTTSFAPLLTPIFAGLRPGGVLIVPDHLSRLESVVRQVLRLGKTPAAAAKDGLMVLSTAEGASAQALIDGRKVFANVWVAPTAVGTDASQGFEQAFADAEGRAPDDQELLVYYAFARALATEDAPVRARLVHVGEDGDVRTFQE